MPNVVSLFCYPPGTGVKQGALCYEDSPTAGNAQCTFNCVNVTQVDGDVFYPLVSTQQYSSISYFESCVTFWQGCTSSLLSTYTPFLSACVTGGTQESMIPLPSGIISSSTGSHATITTTASSALQTPATAGSSAGTPTATGGSNDARERLVGRILLCTLLAIWALLVAM
jgi:hypothetical protein